MERFDVDAVGGHYEVVWCEKCGSIKKGDDLWQSPKESKTMTMIREVCSVCDGAGKRRAPFAKEVSTCEYCGGSGRIGGKSGGDSRIRPPEPLTLNALAAEVIRARLKFPGGKVLFPALVEEVGELAKALLQKRSKDEWQKEAIQVAAVAIRIIEEGCPEFDSLTDAEAAP